MALADYPGFASFSSDLQALLLQAEAGEHSRRAALMARVADALNVFIGLDLLEFVFMPAHEEPAPNGTIDLIASPPDPPPIAWFSVDEAGHDEFREAVSLFGDLTDVLNPPIVLDVDGGVDDGL